MNVLVVDDLEDMRRMIGAMLRRSGVAIVTEAEDGKAALASCAVHLPDVVVMDVQMPGMRGTDATRIITERYPGVVVFGFSAWMEEEADAMLAAGARAVFSKTDFLGLLNAIEAVMPSRSELRDPSG